MAATFITVLEADLRTISTEARKRYPAVKVAAERGILKLRSISEPSALVQSEEVLNTFLLACETKNVKLSAIGLACLQKLIAHEAVGPGALPSILSTLEQHSEIFDESVQLKTLQTSLTVLQSTLHPDKEEDVAVILGICFRLQGSQRCAESVHSTASATLRQAVALIFDRVVSEEGLPTLSSRVGARRVSGHVIPSTEPSLSGNFSWEASSKYEGQTRRRSSSLDEEKAAVLSARSKLSPAAQLGLKLFEDLIALSTGVPAIWLHVPSLPRPFSLDMLEWTLSHYVSIFIMLPPFEQLLRQRVCSLLMTSLRAAGEGEGEGDPTVQRLLLRCVATVTRHYSALVALECEVFLQTLIKSVDLDLPLWNRIYVLEVLKGFCTEARVLRNIFSTFDMRPNNTNVVHDMSTCLAKVVSLLQSPDLSEETLSAVANIFSSKAKGVEWAVEYDSSGNPLLVPFSEAQAIVLAVESLLGIVFTVSTLADQAVDAAEVDEQGRERDERETSVLEQSQARQLTAECLRMIEAVWKTLLEAMSLILSKTTSEAVVLEVLRGYQAFATACGILHATEARDAFLASLCKFTVAYKPDPEGASSPSQPGVLLPAGTKRLEVPEQKDSIVLTAKNVQALRTLFNISHRLDSVLGPAWVLVLETLAVLDRTLHAPHATTQEASSQLPRSGGIGGNSSEFSILSTLDAQLFESTSLMSHEAVLSLLEALRVVSRGAVAGVTSGLGMAASGVTAERGTQAAPKMFALERMVDTVLHNLHRVDLFWDELVAHILELAGHESQHVRMAALDALDRSITAVLGAPTLKKDALIGEAGGAAGNTTVNRANAEAGVEERSGDRGVPFECAVTAPLGTLYSAGRDAEMRAGALRILLHVLERHGETLRSSWPSLLTLLHQVASDQERDILPLGFQSVRVVMSDCLSSLPSGCLAPCTTLAAAYAAQQADLNISLTAITLLWTTADFFGKGTAASAGKVQSSLGAGEEGGAAKVAVPAEAAAGPVESTLSPLAGGAGTGNGGMLDSEAESLLTNILAQLQALCTDGRPEVRNSAVRTFFNAVVNHGSKLSTETWEHCLGDLVLPLLDTMRQLAAGASRDEWVGRELGKQGGKAVHMLVHHSRNTAQKQWDETLVMYLNGITRLLKSHFHLLQDLDTFEEGWNSLLQFMGESIIDGSKEVAVAAASSLHVVLQTHALKGGIPEQYWDGAFDILEVVLRRAASAESRVTLKARIELLENLGRLYTQGPGCFDGAAYLRLLAMVDCLARYPHVKDDTPGPTPMALPQVQRAALDVLPQLCPMTLEQVPFWPAFILQLLSYLPGGEVVRPEHTRSADRFRSATPPAADSAPSSLQPSPLQPFPPDEQGRGAALGSPAKHASLARHHPLASSPGASSFQAAAQTLSSSSAAAPSIDTTTGSEEMLDASSLAEEGLAEVATGALTSNFSERVVALVGDVYCEKTPRDVQVATLPDVVGALGRCMKTRRDAPEAGLWRAAVSTFKAVMEAALKEEPGPNWNLASPLQKPPNEQLARSFSLRNSREAAEDTAVQGRPRLWTVLGELFEEFLLGACGKPPPRLSGGSSAAEALKADEQLELACLDVLTNKVLAHCTHAPDEVLQRLVRVIDRCAARTSALPLGKVVPANCTRFSLACLLKLFHLCGRGAAAEEPRAPAVVVGRVTLPILIERCEYILQRCAEDESQCGDDPLPQMRLEEVITMLQDLARLVLPPLTASVIDVPLGPRRVGSREVTMQLPRSGGGRTSWVDEQGHQLGWERAHLLMLYTPLCEMVLSREARIRELALVLFRLIGAELGLVKDIRHLPV